jgi:hypothetical protein
MSAPILASDRVLLVSSTRSGKSTLASYLFSLFGCQRCLIDPKGEWIVPGAVVTRRPDDLAAALDSAPLVQFVPSTLERQELEDAYEAVFVGRSDLVLWSDELGAVCLDGWAPRYLRVFNTQGAGLGLGHLQCAQRPRRIPREAVTEAQHFFIFESGLAFDDLSDLAREMNLSVDELRSELEALPEYGYLWWQRRERSISAADPLPPELLARAQRDAYKRR